jgi:hypothetical protein
MSAQGCTCTYVENFIDLPNDISPEICIFGDID